MSEQDRSALETTRMHVVKRVTWVGLLCNVFLSIIKCTLGYFGSSQAVVADGIHSLSDLITDLAILVGVKYWSAPADKKHPYGHHRYETLVTVFIGVVLIMAALGLGYNALDAFRTDIVPDAPGNIAAVAALLSIVFKELLYRWTVRKGNEIKSGSVIANAHHHRSDALSSVPVFIAVTIAIFLPEWTFVDGLGAIIVSAFILKAALSIITDALGHLSDTSASDEDVALMQQLVLGVEGVLSTHKIRTRKVGYGVFVDLHVQVNGDISVTNGHDISRVVGKTLKSDGPDVLDVVVHLEPYIDEAVL